MNRSNGMVHMDEILFGGGGGGGGDVKIKYIYYLLFNFYL